MKKIIVIILSAFMITGLSGCAVQSYSTYINSDKYIASSSAVIIDNIDEIEINWASGSVKIEAYDGADIKLSEVSSLDKQNDSIGEATENKTLSESLKMRYMSGDGKLTVQFCKSGLRVRSSAVADLKKDLTVYVPAGSSFKLICAEVLSSDVYINGVTAGEIKLNGMSAKNRLVDCVSDKITVNTMSGNTEITENGTVKSVSYSAMSGNLTIDAEGIEELTAKTMSGNISLNLKKADFTLKLTGATASLEASGINYEITEEKAYKFGDGNGKITVECASGKVSVTVK